MVGECTEILLDDTYSAKVTATQNGLALLTPEDALAPLAQANFDLRLPRLQSEIVVSGHPYEGRLGAATLSYGIMAEHTGLNGESGVLRLALAAQPGDVGGPVLASSGGVVGMLAPTDSENRSLPDDAAFAYDIEKITEFLSGNGVTVAAADAATTLSDYELVTYGRDITTLVSCWN